MHGNSSPVQPTVGWLFGNLNVNGYASVGNGERTVSEFLLSSQELFAITLSRKSLLYTGTDIKRMSAPLQKKNGLYGLKRLSPLVHN